MAKQFGNVESDFFLEEAAPGVFRLIRRGGKEQVGVFSVKDLMQISLTIDSLIDSTYDLSKGGVWPAIAEPSKKKS